jgi:two-component system OmpR family response regulator
MTQTLLVVEDEETLARALAYSLEQDGYRVLTSGDGARGLRLAREHRPDLIILDLMLPTMDGLDICRAIRQDSATPILILTAKAEEVDKIVGLELGADDYMTKPFSMRELIARVKALLRRVDLDQSPSGHRQGAVLSIDGIELDSDTRQVKRNGEVIALRPKEFDLFAYLLRNPSIVLSRDRLLEQVWGYAYAGDTRTVDVHVHWLREKIEDDPSQPKHLVTVRGAGYKLEA